MISFIPVAPTFTTRAMTRVLQLALPDKSLHPPTSALQLISLTSNGDLRAAINSLQMLCSRTYTGKDKKRKLKGDTSSLSATGPSRKRGVGSRGGKGSKIDISDDLRAV